ncbi:DUF2642 domain-containing protein [Salicibibacter halophilus]|uniref:DUF2642 domain-containing protein n=1 Tax=Salicibibacter halophilus TaxID=2502791 RepID=A0A514LMC8_9BACI|nr:YuzF family protein [Salicibibacter halophilus]QDI93017.1 DUF2642 domain-containing protein [Salicibibacter halophilus]
MEWTLSDPYVYHSLMDLENEMVGVQTVRGTLRGRLKSVYPDHIMVDMGDREFFVRVQQIIWFFQAEEDKDHK